MDIEAIAGQMKKMLLERGNIPQIIFVETNQKWCPVILTDMPMESTMLKQMYCYSAGRQVAETLGDESPKQLVFATEAWMSENTEKYQTPSEDPDRLEVLHLSILDLKDREMKFSSKDFQILRYAGSVDLAPLPYNVEMAYDKILISFLAGYVSHRVPDEEVNRIASECLAECLSERQQQEKGPE